VGPSALLGHSRRAEITLARRFVCLSLSKFLGLTNSTIAHYLEKDPSTISHALKTAEVEIESNRIIGKQWNWICSQLGLEIPTQTASQQ
jgi:chromosomal replication initiation ATPase DnaA